MKNKIGDMIKGFTGIIVGTSLLPSITTSVGGAAGKIAGLAQPMFAIGVVGSAAKGSKSLWSKK